MSEWLQQELDSRKQAIEQALADIQVEEPGEALPREAIPLFEKYGRLCRQARGLETRCHDAAIVLSAAQRILRRGDLTPKGRYGIEELMPRLKQERDNVYEDLAVLEHRIRETKSDLQSLSPGRSREDSEDSGQRPVGRDWYNRSSDEAMLNEGNTVPEAQASVDDKAAPETPAADPKDALITGLTDERDQLKDQLLRVMAEAQNVQKRLRQQMDDERKFAAQPLVEKLLPVLDSFERSVNAAEKGASFESLLEGVRAVERQLRAALESVNVKRIESVGKAYDPHVHEALLTHETDDHPADTVIDEIEAGYTMHGRVVRPAKVRVAKKP